MKKEKKVSWEKWDNMEISKKEGGLGFRKIECFNQTLLAKQGWRLLTNYSSLVATIIKAK